MQISDVPGGGPAKQPVSATALQERLAKPAVQSAPPAARPETARAVSASESLENTRLMLERQSSAAAAGAGDIGSMTAAYLMEMRLSLELQAVQEKLAK
ncbi:hypothetical protein DZK27_16375 [Rhodobacteraceae bacterium 63075]|nr:hypothetical protein DZK27_16375 [Rhodobacteraceae bacterium 63075]